MDMFLGTTARTNEPVWLASDDLLTHAVVLGRTGSGKTGATVALIEEAVMAGASAIVIDPKGDLTNLALRFPSLSVEEFKPWVRTGEDPQTVADEVRAQLGNLTHNVGLWRAAADVTIYAPGKLQGGGQAVNILPSFDPPEVDRALMRDRASSVVATLLNAVGFDADPLTDPANVFLTDLVYVAWINGLPMPLEAWTLALAEPPPHLLKIDGLNLEDFFPKAARMKTARALIGFRRQAARWLEGAPLNIKAFVGTGKPRVSVFTLRHLDEGDRMFFSSMLLSALTDYMFSAPASDRLNLLVVLDEAKGYLPPYPLNPPTKKPLTTLLAQGRAQGIGVVIGTQNPVDIDYKALSNVGTWLLGNLRERDCVRDLDAALQARGHNSADLANIRPRQFLLIHRAGHAVMTKIRHTYSYLRGPINSDELSRLDCLPVPNLSGDIELCSFLMDATEQPVSARVVYKAGGSWRHGTMRRPANDLRTSVTGVMHRLVWNTVADIGARVVVATVCIEITGSDGSTPIYTEPSVMTIDNRPLQGVSA